MGAADGKLATLLAAVSPMALGVSVVLLVLVFLGKRLRRRGVASLPAVVALYGGAVGMALMVHTTLL